MEIKITLFTTVLLYAGVISQSIFYMLAMSNVMKSLPAGAYIESRKLLDMNLSKTLSALYYATLISSIALVTFSFTRPGGFLFVAAMIALFALLADLGLIIRGNLPINRIINTWTTSSYPDNWTSYRSKWMSVYCIRQIVNCIGFISLIAGMIFGLA